MANRTVKDAHTIHGTNPQYLIEKIIRSRIYECKYWKEECFALTSELLVDKAMELKYVGGVVGGNIRPTPFICLILKMLQIQPEKDIVVEFIKNEDFKYVRALGAYYMRLTGSALDCYKYLEPLYNDYRKIRRVNRDGTFILTHVDEFVEELISEERSCDVILPRIQKRSVLEENNQLETRVSALEEDLDAIVESGSEEEDYYMEGSKNAAADEDDDGDVGRSGHHDADKRRDRDKDRGRSRSRSRSRSPGGHHRRDKKRRGSRERDRGDRGERDRPRHRSRSRERTDRGGDRGDRGDRGGDRSGRRREEERRGAGRRGERGERGDRGDRGEKESRGEKRSGRDKRGGGGDDDIDDDIREANELRAKLGLPPLRN